MLYNIAGYIRPEADIVKGFMTRRHPIESPEHAVRLLNAIHIKSASPTFLILLLCVVASLPFGFPSIWFAIFSVFSGIGVSATWTCQLAGKSAAAAVWAIVSIVTSMAGLALDDHRPLAFELVQGLGLMGMTRSGFLLIQHQLRKKDNSERRLFGPAD